MKQKYKHKESETFESWNRNISKSIYYVKGETNELQSARI